MRQAIKAMLPNSAKRIASLLLKKCNGVEPRNPETPDSILTQAYQRIGILNYKNDEVSGEAFLLQKIMPALISNTGPLVFDVGANLGDYTNSILNVLPKAKIHAFEPSTETYALLIKRVPSARVVSVMKGMSDKSGIAEFFDYSDHPSAHASLYGEVLSDLHHANGVRKLKVALTTLDDYCAERSLEKIDFIKIDTEGHELAVLQGGKQLIKSGRLPLIQFEFNEMNIVSKSVLKDFYALLQGYEFFRLMPNGLLPLGPYNSRNEIFVFQNILAVKSELYPPALMASFVVSTLPAPPIVKE